MNGLPLNLNHIALGHMIDDIVFDLGGPRFIWQLGVLLLVLAAAWLIARPISRRLHTAHVNDTFALRFAWSSLERAMFPLIGWLLVVGARYALIGTMPISVFRLAAVPLFGLAILYLGFYVLRRVLSANGELHGMLVVAERVLTTLMWMGMVLYVLGVLGDVVDYLDGIRFALGGKQKVSLAAMLMGVVWILVTVLVAMWFGSWLDSRITRASAIDANLKVVLSRVTKAVLLLVSLLLSLSLVGIDLTVLSVFGGALGVGLGFGLQKIASNYVSGFIILLERSLKLGDQITVSTYTGIVTQIRTRYTVVRNGDGDTLVPNELMVAQAVQNHNERGTVRVAVRVQASYAADPEAVLALLVQCAEGIPRVLPEPAPAAFMALFADSGIEYELGVWIADPHNGKLGVQSDLNRAIYRRFKEAGIEIPYPQREVRVLGSLALQGASGTSGDVAASSSAPLPT
ncbi:MULTISPECIES: mechanosensitive ion channel family protein [Ralstonia]|jgi:small-conductance mechanosensitive channel|uniref:Mechanosensitive ion channel protein MscS n=2 Tax=Ralstonia TaxID=48736 RepID=A0AAD2C1I9_9RALS|nr:MULTISPECIES: mechanosensitive ion channel domain-containing protein [Ralstonia]MBB0022669.1 mechanosensitive ion channel family protein [Ralstonia pickettii]MBB0033226.1 mechanosensitive ion channel family protein [Ralstonia pickettii]MBB0096245.1 mechanosensitive ion channel family protein [Ralstonia pickettii]MBB0105694.1 mechanosensitive ion channel family protein [Ralstonia pickettii]MBB0127338.1 mechanosensitive ion channel family protein [Ralstonia pickettii]